jgi:succinate dehydrogenase/fumarate reductase flavoprotein subunit
VISGSGFSTVVADNQVSFNGISATVTSATTTSLTATVPPGATTGVVSVTLCNQTAISADLFVISDQMLVIYDLITPFNTDGINDQFKIENIELTVSNKVTLMDRYGVIVKEWEDFRNYDDPFVPNQDKFDFKQMSPGTYVCILKYQMSIDSPTQSLTQVITILKDK